MFKIFQLLLFCFFVLLFTQCNKHYAFRSKVRTGKGLHLAREFSPPKIKSAKALPDRDAEIGEEENEVSASNDLRYVLTKKQIWIKTKNSKILSDSLFTSPADSSKNIPLRRSYQDEMNGYKQWTFILGFISLFSYPLVLPALFSPSLLYVSLLGRKVQKANGEKVSSRFVFGLITGVFWSLFLSISILGLLIDPTIPARFFILLAVLVLAGFFNWLFIKLINKQKFPKPAKPIKPIKPAKPFSLLDYSTQLKVVLSIMFTLSFVGALPAILLAISAFNHIPSDKKFSKIRLLLTIIVLLAILINLAYVWFGYIVIINLSGSGVYLLVLMVFLTLLMLISTALFLFIEWVINRKHKKGTGSSVETKQYSLTKKALIFGALSTLSFIIPPLTFASVIAILGGLVSFIHHAKNKTGDGWISMFAVFLGLVGLLPLLSSIIFQSFEIYFALLIAGIILGLVFSINIINKHKPSS
ncbi:MAG: hypothetical protein K9H61_10185 [Bacteroidia bacterium]|nr:hypothetical protein [Bacteroidia bacterium]MCF8447351.1 hypothetical protein [Bacteroidia bacterium]